VARKKRKLTKKQRELRKKLYWSLLAVLIVFVFGYTIGKNGIDKEKWQETIDSWETRMTEWWNQNKKENTAEPSPASIRFLDVGQGSATLLQSKDGTTILIDTGRYDDKEKRILQYLDRYVGTGGKIDLLIFTHNDADHIGFGDQILSYYHVKEVWMNGIDATTKVYERVLDAVSDSGAVYAEPKAGEEKQIGPFHLQVLNPVPDFTSDQNDNSISAKIEVNNTALMVTGDAASVVEKNILKKNRSLESTFLLLGHHGSKYSSSSEWIRAVHPDIAIYSAGEQNVYGHPSPEMLDRVAAFQIPVYGTDKNGTISILIDESGSYHVETEKGEGNDEDGTG